MRRRGRYREVLRNFNVRRVAYVEYRINRLKKSIIHFILFCFALLVSLCVAHKQDGGG